MAKLNWTSNTNRRFSKTQKDGNRFHADVKSPPLTKPGTGLTRMYSPGPARSEEEDPQRKQLRATQRSDATVNRRPKPSMPRMPWDEK